MPALKFSQLQIEKIPYLEPDSKKSEIIYRDSSFQGFGLRATRTKKSYLVEKRVAGKLFRPTLGQFPQMSLKDARKKAHEYLRLISEGKDPNPRNKGGKVTLIIAFRDFLQVRGRNLKERTISDYNRSMEVAFKDWKRKKIVDITREMVSRRHKRLGESMGAAQANQHFRFLRALLNFSAGQYEDDEGRALIKENPVKKLSQTGAWFRVERRRTMIKEHDLPAWYKAVMLLTDGQRGEGKRGEQNRIKRNPDASDLLLLLLLTGLRLGEALKLKWEDVDIKAKTFTIIDPKNRNPLNLPIGRELYRIIKRRWDLYNDEDYVFPGREGSKNPYMTEPKKSFKRVTEISGVKFSAHDLRRGFVTTAESLDISSYSVRALVNHNVGSDVTAGYIISDPERLRKPMQKIEDHLLRLCREQKGKLIDLPAG